MHHHVPPSKTRWPSLNLVIFPPLMRLVLDEIWPPPELIDQICELISETRRISANSIAEQLGISRERVESIIHEDLDMRSTRELGPEMLERGSKKSTVPFVWAKFGMFSMRSKWFPVERGWWPWTKPGYIIMNRRQGTSQWSGALAAYLTQKISSEKIRWNSSRFECLGSRRHPPQWLTSKVPNYQRWILLISAGAIEVHFQGKTPRKILQVGHLLAWQCPGSLSTCNPDETGLHSKFWSSTLFSVSDPNRLPPVPLTEQAIGKSPFFVLRGGHCCRGDLVGRITIWFFFWVACKS